MKLDSRVEAIWYDIIAHEGWVDAGKFAERPAICKTIGWLTAEDPSYFTISATRSGAPEGTQYNQHITIPSGAIISMKEIHS